MIKKITEKEFAEVMEKDIALIDFSAAWCGPCQMIAPVLEEVSEELGNEVAFYNIDIDENPAIAMKYDVTSIPTLLVLKKGETAAVQVGFQPKPGLVSFIKSQL
ncbi:MAG: thioredoxin [Clostridia bacterium]|nr:thioredoxin [Clostridia bacterium]